MRSIWRKVFLFLLALVLIFSFPVSKVTYAAQIPQYVRIGLLFNYGSLKTATDSFGVSAEKGVEAGWYGSEGFNTLYTSADNTPVQVKKDSSFYYVYAKDITGSTQAKAKADELTAGGLKAFAAVNSTNSWVVLIGGYQDQASAEADKAASLDKKLPGAEVTLAVPSSKMVVAVNSAGQTIFGFFSDSANLTLRPAAANDLKVLKLNSKAYRGEIEVIRQQSSDMTVVNVVGIEQYLYGVVPAEIGGSSPTEAIKAQAVAARNYTVNNINKYSSIGFNLCNTTYSQVYGGFSAEVLAANKAVDATAGQILMYNGKPAAVFYFSSDGGMTEDVKYVWGSTSFPYLVSVEDNYETPTTTNYTWTKTFTAEQIKSRVSKDIGDVTGLEITQTSPAGRVTELVIKGTKDQAVYKLEGARTVLSLPSQLYTIDSGAGTGSGVSVGVTGNTAEKNPSSLKIMTANGLVDAPSAGISVIGADGTVKNYSSAAQTSGTYTISGKGWGHAVGMSQNGAIGMAKAGLTYKDILEHYFKGAAVQ